VAVVGLAEVLTHLPASTTDFVEWSRSARRRPSAAVLVDFPDFYLRLAAGPPRADISLLFCESAGGGMAVRPRQADPE